MQDAVQVETNLPKILVMICTLETKMLLKLQVLHFMFVQALAAFEILKCHIFYLEKVGQGH